MTCQSYICNSLILRIFGADSGCTFVFTWDRPADLTTSFIEIFETDEDPFIFFLASNGFLDNVAQCEQDIRDTLDASSLNYSSVSISITDLSVILTIISTENFVSASINNSGVNIQVTPTNSCA